MHKCDSVQACKVGYECFFCSKMYKSPFNHRQHLIRRHGKDCDLTTPPPTGRIDPRKLAQAPACHLPPFEARIAPKPPKRHKSHHETPQENPTIDWEEELNRVLQDDLFQWDNDERPITPLSPMKKDFAVQVRKRDFLTTSRDTQTEHIVSPPTNKLTSEIGTQTIYGGVDGHTQTEFPQRTECSCQTMNETKETGIQANFFNAGIIPHTLMDAIKAISPYVSATTSTLRQVAPIQPVVGTPETNAPTRRRGRPRRATPTTSNSNLNPDNDFVQ